MKTVLIPINFQENDANVITFGVRIAQVLDMNAKLLHVLSRPVIPSPSASQAGTLAHGTPPGELVEEQIKQTNESLASIAQKVKDETGFECQYACKLGFVDSQVLDSVEADEIAIVVMGAPHNASWLDQMIGSRSYNVVKQAKIPTLIVPESASYQAINNIVVGVEFERWQADRDNWLQYFVRAHQAKVHYIRIVKESTQSEELALKGFKQRLDENFATDLKTPEVGLIVNEDVDSGIWEYVNKVGGDLIAIQRSDKTFWEHLFSENVTKELMLISDVPVLVY